MRTDFEDGAWKNLCKHFSGNPVCAIVGGPGAGYNGDFETTLADIAAEDVIRRLEEGPLRKKGPSSHLVLVFFDLPV